MELGSNGKGGKKGARWMSIGVTVWGYGGISTICQEQLQNLKKGQQK